MADIEDNLTAKINVLNDRINELEQENDYITSAFMRSETIDHQGNLRGSIVALEKTIENLQVELERSKTDYELLSDDYKQLETAIQQGLLRNRKIQMTHKKYGDATIIRIFQVEGVYWVRAAVDNHLMVETPMSEWELKDFGK